ncbi:MAG: electron transfer flavoprotein subunit alpha/FixB family protein [Deltaproteobacteria bacterium]|nr:electron transfer flavoprotein subunit alpha/FixB family protein [Deltaproteobacteria bacterium]
MKGPITIIVEHVRGVVRPAAYELVTLAGKMQSACRVDIRAVILGDDIGGCAEKFSADCGVPVAVVSDSRLRDYSAELYTAVLADVLKRMEPSFVCVPHSSQGADFASGLALRLGAACITGVEGYHAAEDGMLFYRPIFGGKIRAAIRPKAATTVLTLQPGSCRPHTADAAADAQVDTLDVAVADRRWGELTTRPAEKTGVDLTEAKVLVAAGRGIGEEENLELVRRLAEQFPQSAICGSRPIIDAGWMPYSRQVGVTGATVSPELYVACGISGAVQHLSGMRGAGFVVSVNSDPGAAIFNASDICIVEDLKVFIPQFIQLVDEQ